MVGLGGRRRPPYLALLVLGCGRVGDAPPASTWSPEPLPLEPAVVLGQEEGEPAFLFGEITSVAVDERGRIYVGDRIGATIRAFSEEGRYLGQIARAGEGPGEIRGWPANLSIGRGDLLLVRDVARVTVFAPRSPGAVPDSVAEIWPTPGRGNLTSAPSKLGEDGTYYYPRGSSPAGELPRFFYVPFRGGEAVADTLEVPPYPGLVGLRRAFVPLPGTDGMLVTGLERVPFSSVPSWDVTEIGTLLSTDGEGSELLETDLAGDTIRLLGLPVQPRRSIPPQEKADSLRAMEARIDSLPVPLTQVQRLGAGVAERRIPSALPAVLGLYVAPGGSIWVERWPPEGPRDLRRYDVFDAGGTHLRRVDLQAPLLKDPPPFFGRGAVVGVIRDPGTGIEKVVKFDTTPALWGFPTPRSGR
jgi:hypothetical protein